MSLALKQVFNKDRTFRPKRRFEPGTQRFELLLMDWIEMQINNEQIFPTNVGTPFPKSFFQVAKKILSRLFRVFVHVYIHHFDRVSQMGAEAHVNTCYKHFYYFVTEFNLIDHKELEPLVSVCVCACVWMDTLQNLCVESDCMCSHQFYFVSICNFIFKYINIEFKGQDSKKRSYKDREEDVSL
uniref:MOB kinase activator 3A n=1 Tax=Electrophorus electricus TaxID=8005 RepID=A0AAY5EWR3_ELEEL